MSSFAGLSFARPEALLLLAVLIPVTVYLSRTGLVNLRPSARRVSLALRIVIVTLLVLALSGMSVVQATGRLSVVFLLDRSDSVGAQQRALQSEYLRQAMQDMREGDGAGVIMFGADALVDRPVLPDRSAPDLTSVPVTTYTNVAEAIRLGLAITPADTARRLVLLSDGMENVGSAEWAARLAAAHGVQVDVVPLTTQSGPEVWLDSLQAPASVHEGERVQLQVSVYSSTDTTATLTLFMNGEVLNSQIVQLVPGPNTFVQALPPARPGFHSYAAQVVPPAGTDTYYQNNRYSAYSLVLGKPRLLVVEGHQGEAQALRNALSPAIDMDIISAHDLPPDAKQLAGYDGVVLVNVPASSVPPRALESLQIIVRDLGKGLIVVGGDESYAAGGYARTPLEEMLPVSLSIPSKLDIPAVAMVLVLDRSGSMSAAHNFAGVQKIELAKEAAYQAAVQLNPQDYIGVITFDYQAGWVVQLQPATDVNSLAAHIRTITAGGGTNIYAGLSPAVDALVNNKAKRKHIVLLTDGISEGGDYESLLAKMAANAITLSTVAVGTDADTNFLQWLAAGGKGQFYYTEDGGSLAQIFAHETHFAARAYIIEHEFTPERTSPSPVLEGLGGLPALRGYVGTSPKPTGQVALVSDQGDPILAHWQYGLGRVVAWTSDAKGQWAKNWVLWDGFPQFWAQAVRWATGAQTATILQPRVELEGGVAHITADATTPQGTYLNDLSAHAVVVGPSHMTSTVELRQTAAGRYEGRFPATEEGAYLVQVRASGQHTGNIAHTLGVVVPYSPEYRGVGTDHGLLTRIAALTGGRVLTLDQARAAFDHNLPPVMSQIDLWPLLVLMAVLLLPLDVGVRRVAVSRRDLRHAVAWLRGKLGLDLRPAPATQSASTPQIAALFTARERSRQLVRPQPEAAPPPRPDPATPNPPALHPWARDLQLQGRMERPSSGNTTGGTSMQSPPARQTTAPTQAAHQQPDEPGAADSLAARLRRAREQRR
jgi:Mg-chelatase subunit ChlD